jgi:hypothetical protein
MASEVLVNEDIDVLVRVLKDGSVRPTSFLWRNTTRYVSETGRTWEERVDGRTVRVYLVQTVEGSAYELRYDPAGDQWTIHRAWLRDSVA